MLSNCFLPLLLHYHPKNDNNDLSTAENDKENSPNQNESNKHNNMNDNPPDQHEPKIDNIDLSTGGNNEENSQNQNESNKHNDVNEKIEPEKKKPTHLCDIFYQPYVNHHSVNRLCQTARSITKNISINKFQNHSAFITVLYKYEELDVEQILEQSQKSDDEQLVESQENSKNDLYVKLYDLNSAATKINGTNFTKKETEEVQQFFEFFNDKTIDIYSIKGAKQFMTEYQNFISNLTESTIFLPFQHTTYPEKNWDLTSFLHFINNFQQNCKLRHGIIDGLHRFNGIITTFIDIEKYNEPSLIYPTQNTHYNYTFIDPEQMINFEEGNEYVSKSKEILETTSENVDSTEYDLMQKLFRVLDRYDSYYNYVEFLEKYVTDKKEKADKNAKVDHQTAFIKFSHHCACSMYNTIVEYYDDRKIIPQTMYTDYTVAYKAMKKEASSENVFVKIEDDLIISSDDTKNDMEKDAGTYCQLIPLKKILHSIGRSFYYGLYKTNKFPKDWPFFQPMKPNIYYNHRASDSMIERERVLSPMTFSVITSMIYCLMFPSIKPIMTTLIDPTFWEKFKYIGKTDEKENHETVVLNGNNFLNFEEKHFKIQFDTRDESEKCFQMEHLIQINAMIGTIFKVVLHNTFENTYINDELMTPGEILRNHVTDCFIMFLETFIKIGPNPYHFVYNCKHICFRTILKNLCSEKIVIENDRFVAIDDEKKKKLEKVFQDKDSLIEEHLDKFSKQHSVFEVLMILYAMFLKKVLENEKAFVIIHKEIDDKQMKNDSKKKEHKKNQWFQYDDFQKFGRPSPNAYLISNFTHHNDTKKPQPFLSALLPFESFLKYMISGDIKDMIKDISHEPMAEYLKTIDSMQIFHPYLLGVEGYRVRKFIDDTIGEEVFWDKTDLVPTPEPTIKKKVKKTNNRKRKHIQQKSKIDNSKDDVENDDVQKDDPKTPPKTKSKISHQSKTVTEERNEAVELKKTISDRNTTMNNVLTNYMELYNKRTYTESNVIEIVALQHYLKENKIKTEDIVKKFKSEKKAKQTNYIHSFLETNGFTFVTTEKVVIDLTKDDDVSEAGTAIPDDEIENGDTLESEEENENNKKEKKKGKNKKSIQTTPSPKRRVSTRKTKGIPGPGLKCELDYQKKYGKKK